MSYELSTRPMPAYLHVTVAGRNSLAVQRGLRMHIARSVPDAEAWIDTWVK